MAQDNMGTVRGVLTYICGAVGVLLIIAALLLYAINNVSDASGGKGQGAMITCIVGAVAAFAAAGIVGNLQGYSNQTA